MAVHIENRDKKERDVIQQIDMFFVDDQIPDQHQPGILPIDLTGMNSCLD